MNISSSSKEHSEIYHQQTGDCWAYSVCNVMSRFIIVTFFHYHPNNKFFIGKTLNAHEKETSKILDNWTSFKETISVWASMPQSTLDNVKKNLGPGFFKKNLLYFFLYAILLDSDILFKYITKPLATTFYKNIDIDHFEKHHMRGGFAEVGLNTLLSWVKSCTLSKVQNIFKNVFDIKENVDGLSAEIFEICKLFNDYCKTNKLFPKVKNHNNGKGYSDKTGTKDLKKILNQNLYCSIHVNGDANILRECVSCLNKTTEIRNKFGSHIMTVVGYNKKGKQLIIKNSWDSDWCGNGFFLLNSLQCFTLSQITTISSNLPEYKVLKKDDVLFDNDVVYSNYSKKQLVQKIGDFLNPNPSISNIIDGNKTNIVSSPTKIYKRYKDQTQENNCKTQNKDYNPLTKKCIAKCPAGKIRNSKTMKCIKNI
jgi:hypothetical protein